MSASDVEHIFPVHRDAFADSMGVRLGQRYVTAFFRWFVSQPASLCLVEEEGGRVIGYVIGAPMSVCERAGWELLPHRVAGCITHPGVVFHRNFLRQLPQRALNALRGSRVPAAASLSADTTFSLYAIGVLAAARGRGHGGRLLEAFMRRVWDEGFDDVVLDVYEDNLAARALYERAGWARTGAAGKALRYRITRLQRSMAAR